MQRIRTETVNHPDIMLQKLAEVACILACQMFVISVTSGSVITFYAPFRVSWGRNDAVVAAIYSRPITNRSLISSNHIQWRCGAVCQRLRARGFEDSLS